MRNVIAIAVLLATTVLAAQDPIWEARQQISQLSDSANSNGQTYRSLGTAFSLADRKGATLALLKVALRKQTEATKRAAVARYEMYGELARELSAAPYDVAPAADLADAIDDTVGNIKAYFALRARILADSLSRDDAYDRASIAAERIGKSARLVTLKARTVLREIR